MSTWTKTVSHPRGHCWTALKQDLKIDDNANGVMTLSPGESAKASSLQRELPSSTCSLSLNVKIETHILENIYASIRRDPRNHKVLSKQPGSLEDNLDGKNKESEGKLNLQGPSRYNQTGTSWTLSKGKNEVPRLWANNRHELHQKRPLGKCELKTVFQNNQDMSDINVELATVKKTICDGMKFEYLEVKSELTDPLHSRHGINSDFSEVKSEISGCLENIHQEHPVVKVKNQLMTKRLQNKHRISPDLWKVKSEFSGRRKILHNGMHYKELEVKSDCNTIDEKVASSSASTVGQVNTSTASFSCHGEDTEALTKPIPVLMDDVKNEVIPFEKNTTFNISEGLNSNTDVFLCQGDSLMFQKPYSPTSSTLTGLEKRSPIANCHKTIGAVVKDSYEQKQNFTNKVEMAYKCDVCAKTFTDFRALQTHKKIHTGKKSYECDVCGKTFTQAGHLRAHKRIHTGEKPYECNVCGKTFTQVGHLQRHKMIHTGEKPYECDVCGKTFTNDGTLHNHKKIHTGEKPYKCDICDKTFTEIGHLQKHVRIHTGEKPYNCDVCGKTFTQNCTLQTHKLIHSRKKSQKHDVSSKTFTKTANLQKHTMIFTGEKPYECDVCGKTFIENNNLQNHKRIHK